MRAGKVDVLVSDPRSVDGIKLEQPLCFDALEFGDESRFFAVAVGPNEIALYNVACSKFLAYGDDGHRHSGGRMIPSLMGSPFSTNLVKGWEDPVPCPSHFFIKHASPY
ncbi:hypothetical protein M885DRAFT_512225 [Pelagophyceae sp. CCMP2097]|nr:hypothetical protein M885DRAFT_512225 [Pelagophyceae sp. CCMP2097]|mmetsp:Transcript_23955/g.81887  ORF Transcript_23955/g.81887 Transcript_23955/m.81887 type:complete len:109 (-) Transcript_23955:20-346(-)